ECSSFVRVVTHDEQRHFIGARRIRDDRRSGASFFDELFKHKKNY
ncbi:unnamed protein product, partial [Rotaria magnacalcarata]